MRFGNKNQKKKPNEEKLHVQKLIKLVKENYLGTLVYEERRHLIAIEYRFEDKVTLKISRFDLLIKDSDIDGTALDNGVEVAVEVKNWTGFEKLDKEKQNARFESLELQLVKYLASGNKVQLEWKGKIPDSVKLLCNEDNLNINIKEI